MLLLMVWALFQLVRFQQTTKKKEKKIAVKKFIKKKKKISKIKLTKNLVQNQRNQKKRISHGVSKMLL